MVCEILKGESRTNEERIKHLQNECVRLDKNVTITNQYNRRENLVIDGIPDHVPQENLEKACLDIIHELGFLPVGHYEVVGCHRLKKKEGDPTKPTIIRFVNRKVPEFCMKNRWRLKNLRFYDWNLSFREDLCDSNQAILTECERLKADGLIHKVFTHKGFVKVVKTNKDHAVKITHISELH